MRSMPPRAPSVPPPSGNVRRSVPPNGRTPMPSDPPVALDVTARESSPRQRRFDFDGARAFGVLRVVMGVLLIAGIGAGVAWGARRYVRTSPRFAVSEIMTVGGKRRGPDELANIAGVAKGQNVFSIDLDRARSRLAADPWIESAEIARQLPGTIAIRVSEREAAGLVAMSEGNYLVTRDGVIIKRVEAGDPIDFDVVTGVPLRLVLDDREAATRMIRGALDLALDYGRSPLAQRAPLQEAHVEPSGDLTLVVGKSGVVLRMGAGPYRKKLEQAVRIVAELDRRGAKPDTIMLDDEARPDRVVVRMR